MSPHHLGFEPDFQLLEKKKKKIKRLDKTEKSFLRWDTVWVQNKDLKNKNVGVETLRMTIENIKGLFEDSPGVGRLMNPLDKWVFDLTLMLDVS